MSSKQNVNEAAMLDTVKASPTAVAAHDKATWLALFADDADINDPIGSKPHKTAAARDRFYETFIAPNKIRFVVENDIVCGHTVVRDVTIMTEMPTGLVVGVPTHIRYELVEDAQQTLKIQRLFAHWELLVMVLRTLGTGWLGLRTYAKLSWRMIRCQGIFGVLGFMRGFSGVGGAGKRRGEAFLTALASGDVKQAKRYLPIDYSFEFPAGQSRPLADLMQHCHGLRWRKLMAAGMYVSASINVGQRRGVVFLQMDRRKRVEKAMFYLAQD